MEIQVFWAVDADSTHAGGGAAILRNFFNNLQIGKA
jgi:hypothetical protein